MEAEVEYHKEYKMKNQKFEHELNFDASNTSRNVVVEIDPEVEAKIASGYSKEEVKKVAKRIN